MEECERKEWKGELLVSTLIIVSCEDLFKDQNVNVISMATKFLDQTEEKRNNSALITKKNAELRDKQEKVRTAKPVIKEGKTIDKCKSDFTLQQVLDEILSSDTPYKHSKHRHDSTKTWSGKKLNNGENVTTTSDLSREEQNQQSIPLPSGIKMAPEIAELLEIVRIFKVDQNDENCKIVLKAIYEICYLDYDRKLNIEEQREIGEVLAETVHYIFNYLIHFGITFDPEDGLMLLKYRSALEFIFVKFENFQLQNKSLNLKTYLNKIESTADTIGSLDDAIKYFKDNIVDMVNYDSYSRGDLVNSKLVDDKHSWWLNK
ncbi:hypothetical protein Btru_061070 [Bulinus truncatus]|nr:hypothetical protein Btru_061070 [Bulinus truncatus]